MSGQPDSFRTLADMLGKASAEAFYGKQAKPLPQIRGKEIGGVFYVRAEDVADALESQDCAPRLVKKLRRR